MRGICYHVLPTLVAGESQSETSVMIRGALPAGSHLGGLQSVGEVGERGPQPAEGQPMSVDPALPPSQASALQVREAPRSPATKAEPPLGEVVFEGTASGTPEEMQLTKPGPPPPFHASC